MKRGDCHEEIRFVDGVVTKASGLPEAAAGKFLESRI